MHCDAVIFGNNGVLTKPTLFEIQWEAVGQAFDEFDVEPTTETVNGVINGSLTHLRRICVIHDVPVDDSWLHHEVHTAATQQAYLESGTEPLCDGVVALDDIDYPLTVVSNNQHATIKHILNVFNIDDRFEVAHGHGPTVEGVRMRKPDPHYIERAMSEPGADSVLYVGDSNIDVVTADCTGIDSTFIRRPHRDDYQLAAEPTYELNSFNELLAVC